MGRSGRRLFVGVVITALAFTTSACGSEEEAMNETTVADTTANPTVVPTTGAPTPEPTSTTGAPTTAYPMVRGSQYCELLFLAPVDGTIRVTVYGTQGLSYCPDEAWRSIDTAALAADEGALFVLPNGPRGWLVDAVRKDDIDPSERRTFGELEMNRLASITITDPTGIGQRYTWQEVDRRSVFTFAAGSTEFFLTDAEGRRYVMQAWSEQADPSMSEESLPSLGERLTLPEGWTYSVEVLEEDLVVDTMDTPARVLQDEYMNSYSWIPGT